MTPADRLVLLLARGRVPADLAGPARGLAGGVDWPRVVEVADAHGVAPLVGRNLAALGWPDVPPAARDALETAWRVNAARSALHAQALARVLAGFANAGIPAIPMKGVALSASLYGDAAARTSADLDVLVPPSAVPRAFGVLAGLGYAATGDPSPADARDLARLLTRDARLLLESNIEQVFASPDAAGCPVELHWDIAWRWPHGAVGIADLWASARPRSFGGSPALAMSPEWEVLYLAVHAARHRWSALKWLVDVHEICARGAVDWARARERAARFGLADALDLTLGACAALLGTTIPAGARARPVPRWVALFPAMPAAPDIWREALSPARLFRHPAARVGYLARVLLVPTLAERRLIRLPRSLHGLYYALRPLRLLARWAEEKWLGLADCLTSPRPPADHRASMRRFAREAAGPIRSGEVSA
jgi:hypothetical protein